MSLAAASARRHVRWQAMLLQSQLIAQRSILCRPTLDRSQPFFTSLDRAHDHPVHGIPFLPPKPPVSPPFPPPHAPLASTVALSSLQYHSPAEYDIALLKNRRLSISSANVFPAVAGQAMPDRQALPASRQVVPHHVRAVQVVIPQLTSARPVSGRSEGEAVRSRAEGEGEGEGKVEGKGRQGGDDGDKGEQESSDGGEHSGSNSSGGSSSDGSSGSRGRRGVSSACHPHGCCTPLPLCPFHSAPSTLPLPLCPFARLSLLPPPLVHRAMPHAPPFTHSPPLPPFPPRQPVTWASLALLLLTGGALLTYFESEKRKRLEAVRELKPVGKAAIGGPFTLVDGQGKTFTDADLKGRWALLYFGFTFCPDICPSELIKIAQAVDLVEKQVGVKVVPVFISVDPERDTAEQVKEYVKEFHPRMIGLTGTPEQVKAAARAFRVYYMKTEEEGYDYLVDHSIISYLMSPEFEFVKFFGRNHTPEGLADGIAGEIKGHGKFSGRCSAVPECCLSVPTMCFHRTNRSSTVTCGG
ncbi:unnamed protein product, partial [Closterium sp. Naga37s-1]